MTDLGLPPGATSAGATAVNDDGLVVGNSDAGPWVYEPISKTFTMIAGADTATGINDSGEIVGVGQVPDPLVPPPPSTGPRPVSHLHPAADGGARCRLGRGGQRGHHGPCGCRSPWPTPTPRP